VSSECGNKQKSTLKSLEANKLLTREGRNRETSENYQSFDAVEIKKSNMKDQQVHKNLLKQISPIEKIVEREIAQEHQNLANIRRRQKVSN